MVYAASRGSYEDFLSEYTPADATKLFGDGRPLLFKSVGNKDVRARVSITDRLLDDGADPSFVSDTTNVLHVLFDQRAHDMSYEAPMLRRLIDGGADINQVSKRSGPPLVVLMKHGPVPESLCVPFYDVIFDQPDLDFTVPYLGGTLRDFIFDSAYNLPILREKVLAYEAAREKA